VLIKSDMRERQTIRTTRAALTIVLLVAVGEATYLVLRGQYPVMVPIALAALTGSAWWLAKDLMRRGVNPRWVLVSAVVIAITIIPELGLRTIGYQYGACSEYGPLHPGMRSYFVPDEDLFWKRPTSEPGVNSCGFYGPDITNRKPPSVFRIVILGDSCAEQDYARLLEQCLNDRVTDATRFECIPLAVAGYSSYQGRVLAEKYAAGLEPDLAIVCFGWNDHWLACRYTDEAFGQNRTGRRLVAYVQRSRLVQLCRQALAPLVAPPPTPLVRVSPQQYENNLLHIAGIFRRLGTPVLFMTAPSAYSRLGVPNYIVQEHLAPSKSGALKMHRSYNDIVRRVASIENGKLVDLASEFDQLNFAEELFTSDGIHFTEAGLRKVSELLCTTINNGAVSRNNVRP